MILAGVPLFRSCPSECDERIPRASHGNLEKWKMESESQETESHVNGNGLRRDGLGVGAESC